MINNNVIWQRKMNYEAFISHKCFDDMDLRNVQLGGFCKMT